MVVSLTNSSPIDAPSEVIESSFQSFEITGANYVKVRATSQKPQISRVTKNVAKFMLERGFCPGNGLGKKLHGIRKPMEMKKHPE